ncbi:MAG: COX15/CtaA family protein [Flavobacteriales bacterium]|nr:COX15/CtaA family protein [Flavobacteriales bacterium]
MSFKSFAKLTLISIFLIIVAGSVVRMTVSGMGCPDWPKCFGFIIPPTSVDQIEWEVGKSFFEGQMIIYEEQLWSAKSDFVSGEKYNSGNWILYTIHDYAKFNPAHTWTEYINRLIGAISGVLTFVMLLMSFRYWKTKRKIVSLSALVVFLMGFQGWLGATVVYSVLQPVQITIHMLMALLIVALMVYLIYELPESSAKNVLVFDKNLNRVLVIAIGLSLVQIALGTQVRQIIDEISSGLDYGQRELWIGLAGNTFKVHRSFAIVLVLINGLLFFRNYKFNLGFKLVNAVFAVVILEVVSGIILTYFDMMALMQPIHLVAASGLFVLQIALYFQLKKLRPFKTFN